METVQTIKKRLVFEIEHLPNPEIAELQNFIQYLKFKQLRMAGQTNDEGVLRPEDDPILCAFGLFDVAPFSDTIDDALYGAL